MWEKLIFHIEKMQLDPYLIPWRKIESMYIEYLNVENSTVKTFREWEFPGGPVVETQRFHCHGPGFDSASRAAWPKNK